MLDMMGDAIKKENQEFAQQILTMPDENNRMYFCYKSSVISSVRQFTSIETVTNQKKAELDLVPVSMCLFLEYVVSF